MTTYEYSPAGRFLLWCSNLEGASPHPLIKTLRISADSAYIGWYGGGGRNFALSPHPTQFDRFVPVAPETLPHNDEWASLLFDMGILNGDLADIRPDLALIAIEVRDPYVDVQIADVETIGSTTIDLRDPSWLVGSAIELARMFIQRDKSMTFVRRGE